MSDESLNRQPNKSPHTVESTNSSVTAVDSPENGSTILNTSGNARGFMAETVRSYIDALKFNTTVSDESEALVNKRSSLVVEELLGRDKNSSGSNKPAKSGGANTKSRVTFSSANKQSSAQVHQLNSSLLSQQQLDPVKRDKSKSSTNTVIRQWGKRPMLVESEAPWTPRNRMYLNAIKAVERARQLNPNGVVGNRPTNLPPSSFIQQQQLYNNMEVATSQYSQLSPQPMSYVVNNGRNLPMVLPVNVPQMFPYGLTAPIGQQQPFITGISPVPIDIINNRPLAVALDPPPLTNQYVYQQHPEMVFPTQQQQTVIYRQLNSEGVWVPMMEQPQLYPPYQHNQQQQP